VQRVVEGATHASFQIKPADAQLTSAAIIQVVQAARMGEPVAR